MDTTLWFCTNCGAGNGLKEGVCFACEQKRDEEPAEDAPWILQDRFRIIGQVGRGGFGIVYRGVDMHHDNRPVAIKQITMQGLSTTEIIEATDAFHREVQLLSLLRHPSLPRIYARFTDADNWYIVMDFVQGETLEHYLARRSALASHGKALLPLEEILQISLQLSAILEYLHTRQPAVIFRDLKPSNIVRPGKDRLFLIDFGTARRYRPGQRKDTIPLGSPGYAAPEQYGRAQTTPRSDIYSLGALLHYMLSGDDPADNPFHFKALPSGASEAEGTLASLVMRMVEREENKRPARIQDISEQLQQLLDQQVGALPRGYQAQKLSRPPSVTSPSPWSTTPVMGQIQQMYSPGTSYQSQQKQSSQMSRRLILMVLGALGAGVAGNTIAALTTSHYSSRETRAPIPAEQQPISTGELARIVWSDNNKRLAFQYHDGTVRVVDATTSEYGLNAAGNELYTSKAPPSYNIALSPDGNLLAQVSASPYQVGVYNLSTQQTMPAVLLFPENQILNMAWSPDNQWLALSLDRPEKSLVLWNALGQHGEEIKLDSQTTSGFQGSLRWSPDGKRLFTSTASDTLEVWNVETQQHVARLTSDTAPIAAAWSPTSQQLAVTDAGRIQIHELQTTSLQARFHFSEMDTEIFQPVALSYSPQGQYLVAYYDELMQIWSTHTTPYELIYEEPIERIENIQAFALNWSSDGKTLLVASDDQIIESRQIPDIHP